MNARAWKKMAKDLRLRLQECRETADGYRRGYEELEQQLDNTDWYKRAEQLETALREALNMHECLGAPDCRCIDIEASLDPNRWECPQCRARHPSTFDACRFRDGGTNPMRTNG